MKQINNSIIAKIKEHLQKPALPIPTSTACDITEVALKHHEESVFYYTLIRDYLSKARANGTFTVKEAIDITSSLLTFENMRDYAFIIVINAAKIRINYLYSVGNNVAPIEAEKLEFPDSFHATEVPLKEDVHINPEHLELYYQGISAYYLIVNYLYNATAIGIFTEKEVLRLAKSVSRGDLMLDYANNVIDHMTKYKFIPETVIEVGTRQ